MGGYLPRVWYADLGIAKKMSEEEMKKNNVPVVELCATARLEPAPGLVPYGRGPYAYMARSDEASGLSHPFTCARSACRSSSTRRRSTLTRP